MLRLPLSCLTVPLLGVAMLGVLPLGAAADNLQLAGCQCNNGGDGAQPAVAPPMNGCASSGPNRSCGPAGAEDSAFFVGQTLPPGTLGRTYLLPSRAVPANKHPRVAMIDICCPAATHIVVRWTNDFRTEETLKGYQDEQNPSLWHFESKPLVPGLTLIYRVEIYQGGPGSNPTEVRYVRLIKGRVVFLTV